MSSNSNKNYRALYEQERALRIKLEEKLKKEQAALVHLNENLVDMNVSLEMKVAERTAELEDARDQALFSAKIKSDFLANISHEIRTPLNGVIGLLAAMANSDDNSKRDELIDIALESSQQLLNILNDVLEFSKFESLGVTLEPQKTNLRKLINYSAHQFSFIAQKKHLNLRTEIDLKVPDSVYTDGFRIKQVVNNLISNAIKFTQQGEVVVAVKCLNEADIELSVTDTGIGMDARQQSRIFNAFNQGDSSITRRFGGTGLGLTICAQIVKAMQSEIAISSRPGKGSKFSFTLYLPWRSDETLLTRYAGKLREKQLYIFSRDSSIPLLIEQLQQLGIGKVVWVQNEFLNLEPQSEHLSAYCLMDCDTYALTDDAVQNYINTFEEDKRILLSRYHSSKEMAIDSSAQLFKPLRFREFLELLSKGKTHSENSPRKMQDLSDKTLLVVDDNEINRVVMEELLAATNCKIITADTGRQAVNVVTHHAPDLIFMDIQMPEMDGLSATREIRSLGGKFEQLPIIAMTAHASPSDVQRCRQVQMNAHLVKPVEPQALWAVLRKYFGVEDPGEAELPMSPLELPLIEGFDLDDALSRIQNNFPLLQRLLRQFCANFESTDVSLTSLINSGQWQQAAQLVHSLKGTAANLGGVRLKTIAEQIENRLRSGDRGDFSAEIATLSNALSVLPDIVKWLQQDFKENSPGKPTVLDALEFDCKLRELDAALEDDICLAQDTLQLLQNSAPRELQSLVKEISGDFFDYNLEAVHLSILGYLERA